MHAKKFESLLMVWKGEVLILASENGPSEVVKLLLQDPKVDSTDYYKSSYSIGFK